MKGKQRTGLLEKAIINMIVHFCSDGNGGSLPEALNDWSTAQLKQINKTRIEFFSYLNNVTEVVSAKTFACYIDGFQKGFKLFYKFNIKIRNGDVFTDPETVFFLFLRQHLRE